MRTFSGAEEFKKISDSVLTSYRKLFPVEKNGYRMEAERIWLADDDIDPHDYTQQKKVKLNGGTFGVPVMASLVLKDSAGKVVDRIDQVRISTIPRITPRRSYIVKGNEYQIAHQMIRKPAAYIVPSQKGDTFKGMVSLGGESTKNFDLQFSPTTNKFTVDVGTSSRPLFPLLRALGTTEQELSKAFGEEVYRANFKDSDGDYTKLAKRLTRSQASSKQEAIDALREFAKTTKVDPSVTELTLGQKHTSLTKGMLLDTAKKLFSVYQGSATPDDPENLIFKEIRSAEDMILDRLTSQKEQDAMKRMLSRHLGRRESLKKMIDFRKLTAPVESFFTSDDRSSTPEQYNPVHMLAEASKLTIHGTGGITSEHAVADALREAHPSHIGFVDLIHTPESSKTGTVVHLASGTNKSGREINTTVLNAKTKKIERLTPREVYDKVVAFPDEYVDGKFRDPKAVRAQSRGKVLTVPASQVDAILPTPVGMFSHSSNLIPFLQNNNGARGAMASKMLGQALPLVEREAPLVQTEVQKGITFQKAIGEEFVVRSPIAGVIREVTADYIKINDRKVPIYNNFPLNQKTHLHHEPKVKVGDKVAVGQLLADSNFTKDGTLALGKNLTVAYMPIPGHTFEDGIVITESAAKKLSAEVQHKHAFQIEEGKNTVNLKKWVAYYGAKLPKEVYQALDQDGVVKKGTIVKPGDLLIAGLTNNLHSPENATLRKINKALMLPWADSSVKYTGEFHGVVTDVVKKGDQVTVFVKSVEPARESDKLSGVHGNKGVISKVIPDHEAPRTKDGKVPDVFINPHGIITRINVGQLYESAASKIAQKTGKPYLVQNFDGRPTNKKILDELKQHGISDTETLYTPDGKKLGDVSVGNPYILRLAKTGKSGFSARIPGTGYDNNLQPLRGGEGGTKSLDPLMFYSMLAHGAKKNLLDAHYKSERNDEFWHAVETGKPIPAPKATFAFEKFVNLIRGAGVNVEKKGGDFTLAPLTDKDIKQVSRGAITDPRVVQGKNLKEIKGGLFDVGLTGGMNGTHYAHIEMPERLPNPVFASAISSLTGLKQKQYEEVASGKMFLTKSGQVSEKYEPGASTGGEAIAALLDKIDVNALLAKTKDELKKAALSDKKAGDIDRLNRKIRYLQALKDLNMSPSEAYTRKLVPVIPPIYRPVQEIQGKKLSVAPANELYRNVGILAKAHQYDVMKLMGEEDKQQLREETYRATKQLAGLESLTTRGKEQPIEGFISQITGDAPKRGFFLNKLITKKQDLIGRGVITNGPDLHVDELGIPEKMAWKIFRPFIIENFVRQGYRPDMARTEIDKQTPLAHDMLKMTMKQRTVLMNRAPSLHKFSVMAFKPVLTDGLAIRVPPLVYKGFNADIDGDAVNIHVPVTSDALRESQKMFPSNHLFKPGTGDLMMSPSQESAIGLYFLSATPEGRKKINAVLPSSYKISGQLTKKEAKDLYNRLAKNEPQKFANIINDLKNLGDVHSYQIGFSTALKDLSIDTKTRDSLFAKADRIALQIQKTTKPGAERDAKIGSIYEKAAKEAYEKSAKKQLAAKGSNFYHMVASGARGNDLQLQQMVSAPGVLKDARDRVIPVPVKRSYAEGLKTSDYFIAAYGVRKGMMDRALQTSKPGALNKDILATTVDNSITTDDCGVQEGISIALGSKDNYDRYLAKDQYGLKRNTLVTPQVVTAAKRKGAKALIVRSPLKCLAEKGTCAHCFGLDEHSHRPSIGENVGVKMGQAISEPVTQFTMRTFHTGGVAGGASVSGFTRVNQLLNMPSYVSGAATLSTHSGKVERIERSPAGGSVITVSGTKHTSRPGLALKVKVGDSVMAGDPLTEGVVRPQDLVKHKGMEAAQAYITDELQNTYRQQGVDIDRKVFETVIRSVANNTQVIAAPAGTNYIPGDIIPYNVARAYNEKRKVEVPVANAADKYLPTPVGRLPAMHKLTDKDLVYLKEMGHKKITVYNEPLVHKPLVKGIQQLPMLKKDWMAQFGYRKIKEGLTEGAAQRYTSSVEGSHPVPQFAYGINMGRKKDTY